MKLWGTRVLLEEAKIPTPSSLLGQILALKLAELKPGPDFAGSDSALYFDLYIQDGTRKLEISCQDMIHTNPSAIKVGMPGSPAYRTVEFSYEDRRMLGLILKNLRNQSNALAKADREAESEHNALDILEYLL